MVTAHRAQPPEQRPAFWYELARMSRPSRGCHGLALLLVVGILLVGAGLRFSRIGAGLDPDEFRWFQRAAAFVPLTWQSFDLDARLFFYPTLFGYAAGAWTWIASALGLPASKTQQGFVEIVLIARSVSAFFGLVTVAVVGAASLRMYSLATSLVAMAFAALNPVELIQLHSYASADVLLTACFALSVLAAHQLAATGTATAAVVAGVAVGLAFTAKYTGLAALAPVAWAILEVYRREGSPRRVAVLGCVALLALAGTA